MELQFFGANCVRINTKQGNIVIDDNLKQLGAKGVVRPEDIAIYTALPPSPAPKARLIISDPGEYEVSDISVFGVAARGHLDESGQESATIYKIQYDDLRLVVLGHIHPDISNDQLEDLGAVDVLISPVGGHGYTLDAVGAMSIMKKIEPKIFILTHYDDPALNYPVPQRALEDVLKEISMEAKERTSKLKVKPGEFAESTQLIILEKS